MAKSLPIFRVDKFSVPEAAREEFLKRVHDTHQVLRRQPGFIRDSLLEQVAGSGRFNIVTIAEWENQEAIDAARLAVTKAHREKGFDPQESMARLGIEADIANYQPIEP
ncbi:antibiotic biosynthesis monooxygenase family protein [Billgrantia bachuensis]|uniref:Antibiotic biosynthesis monooxygenase n=1 Tax=Billgrantia bachuensis TaxID=2717286 RepID=A0ABX0PTR5_9GAMM|nr:antibiotic biosynthesis monooxygenase family protein [Halomonas bachuensis]NIC04854.1 antibiotic biosynthesis monooxygenase [Halomonas bachuensis]